MHSPMQIHVSHTQVHEHLCAIVGVVPASFCLALWKKFLLVLSVGRMFKWRSSAPSSKHKEQQIICLMLWHLPSKNQRFIHRNGVNFSVTDEWGNIFSIQKASFHVGLICIIFVGLQRDKDLPSARRCSAFCFHHYTMNLALHRAESCWGHWDSPGRTLRVERSGKPCP